MALLYFILGILFVEIIIPILDAILNIFLAWVETKKAKYSEIVTESNIKMKRAVASIEEIDMLPPKRQIGFVISAPEEQEEEDDEDDI